MYTEYHSGFFEKRRSRHSWWGYQVCVCVCVGVGGCSRKRECIGGRLSDRECARIPLHLLTSLTRSRHSWRGYQVCVRVWGVDGKGGGGERGRERAREGGLVIHGGEDPSDALSCRSFFANEPLMIGLFCGKWPIKIRQPMGLRHPVESVRECVCVWAHAYVSCETQGGRGLSKWRYRYVCVYLCMSGYMYI